MPNIRTLFVISVIALVAKTHCIPKDMLEHMEIEILTYLNQYQGRQTISDKAYLEEETKCIKGIEHISSQETEDRRQKTEDILKCYAAIAYENRVPLSAFHDGNYLPTYIKGYNMRVHSDNGKLLLAERASSKN